MQILHAGAAALLPMKGAPIAANDRGVLAAALAELGVPSARTRTEAAVMAASVIRLAAEALLPGGDGAAARVRELLRVDAVEDMSTSSSIPSPVAEQADQAGPMTGRNENATCPSPWHSNLNRSVGAQVVFTKAV